MERKSIPRTRTHLSREKGGKLPGASAAQCPYLQTSKTVSIGVYPEMSATSRHHHLAELPLTRLHIAVSA